MLDILRKRTKDSKLLINLLSFGNLPSYKRLAIIALANFKYLYYGLFFSKEIEIAEHQEYYLYFQ